MYGSHWNLTPSANDGVTGWTEDVHNISEDLMDFCDETSFTDDELEADINAAAIAYLAAVRAFRQAAEQHAIHERRAYERDNRTLELA